MRALYIILIQIPHQIIELQIFVPTCGLTFLAEGKKRVGISSALLTSDLSVLSGILEVYPLTEDHKDCFLVFFEIFLHLGLCIWAGDQFLVNFCTVYAQYIF